ncbi:hypothetical protein [Solicola sp. PLA-1-18]|uniref:hypothetical protein n=1 Tax=Solicola sp. PLA-1-18 TaxID=3380532 RepID=UPI003B7E179B
MPRAHASTRLVADGRLAVRVPAAWPTVLHGGVGQSCVVVMPRAVLAVGWAPPPPGTVAVRLGVVGADEAPVTDGIRRSEHLSRSRLQGDRVELASRELGGALVLEGDLDLARAVAATAHPLPDGAVAVPNVWHASTGDDPSPSAEEVEALVTAAGLRAVVEHRGRPSKQNPSGLAACDPMVGEVLPRGADVRVLFST